MRKVIFIILFLTSCHSDNDLVLYKFDSKSTKVLNLNKMGFAYNCILFIGKKDSLYNLREQNAKVPYDYFLPSISDKQNKYKDRIKDVPLKIFIDTSNIVNIHFFPDIPSNMKGKDYTERREENICLVDAYPVYICNYNEEYTSLSVQGATVELVQEAKNIDGHWKPIEYYTYGFCGNGYADFILAPDYYVITSIYKYTGNFKTEIRVKVMRGKESFYSNTIIGNINRQQFASLINK